MASILNKSIAEAIYLSAKDKNREEQSLVIKRTVAFLAKKRLFSKAKGILASLDKMINEKEGRVVARISSAEPLNEKTKTELTHALTKRYSAKEVRLEEKLEKKLIGGIKIEVGDEMIDLSLKNRIKKLQEHLTKSK